MPRVGFEPMIPASKRAKTVHALDHSDTVTGQSGRTAVINRSIAFRNYVRNVLYGQFALRPYPSKKYAFSNRSNSKAAISVLFFFW
jgi:hypothetical protein